MNAEHPTSNTEHPTSNGMQPQERVGPEFYLVQVVRPDGTLLWLPGGMAKLLGLKRRMRITEEILNHREVQALIASRFAANKAGAHCTNAWHQDNGYV